MRPTPGLTFFTLAGSLAYLALPIVGWGGVDAYFANPARTTAAVATMAMAVIAIFSGGNLSKGDREDRGNRWVLVAFGVLGLLAGYVPALTDRLDFWTIGDETVRWIGDALFITGGMLRLWPVFVLGNRFSGLVAIQPGHTLVTTGVYAVIRNPSYLGLVVSSLGWVLVFRSLLGVLLTALTLWPLIARIRAEEALLRKQFGDEYERYCARTWRMVPGVY
ncbi:methyltransferase family protein [Cupriavidus pauculus]|uniref:Isoprenylcysteine carboxyl methyltransferase n=1 Tax=Cupriavidus pauculus TaxID=82633 RepID=A0A2N5CIC5_9BURK|nr:isoprenylcysteine carboxylmethyltransferase family protein [Cupriavidus pauculus]PLQ01937.1 isoprenylcysteine carboxyl methyltransferase [Cupriavidus pauculus]